MSSAIHMIRAFMAWVCITCKLGVYGDNLALHKPAWQSSVHPHPAIESLDAPNAVDGRLNPWFGSACMHTKTRDESPWIVVDLLGQFYVTAMKLYNRQDCCQTRLHDFVIEVFETNPTRCASAKGSVCKNYIGVLKSKYKTLQCVKPVVGRFIRILKTKFNAPGDVLSLCEVEVFGEQTAFAPVFIGMVNGSRLNSNSVMSVSVRSRMYCVVQCGMSGVCVGVNYNTKNGVCELLTRPEPSDTVSEQDDWVFCGQDLC